MQCPNGSHVGRTGPHCEFATCPGLKSDFNQIDTSALKTYRNEVYGFEMRLPTDWKIEEIPRYDSKGDVIPLQTEIYLTDKFLHRIIINPFSSGYSSLTNDIAESKTINIDGTAKWTKLVDPGGINAIYVNQFSNSPIRTLAIDLIPINAREYVEKMKEQEFQQILSTIKFIQVKFQAITGFKAPNPGNLDFWGNIVWGGIVISWKNLPAGVQKTAVYRSYSADGEWLRLFEAKIDGTEIYNFIDMTSNRNKDTYYRMTALSPNGEVIKEYGSISFKKAIVFPDL